LDGFRAISIILVVISHGRFSRGFPFQNSELPLWIMGSLGVSVFFVISGFLITYLLLAEDSKNGRIDVKHFYIRRAIRIIPVYALYLIFVFLCIMFVSFYGNFHHINFSAQNLVHILTFTVNFDKNIIPVFQHFWSLSVEEQFYFIWPATLIIFRKHLKIVILIFMVFCCLSRVFSYKFPDYAVYTLSPFFNFSDAIFIGAFGGILFFENKKICKLKMFSNYGLQLIMVVLIVTFKYFSTAGKFGVIALPFGNTIISFSILFLIFAYITPSDKVIFKILNYKAVVHIGVLSYSIYIWQQFFFMGNTGAWRIFPYNIVEVYVVALASYYLWEQPFLKLKNRFSANKLQL
jgi:peptidoglycan/LPS O-acetylase OafA/YrhL